MPDVRAQTIAIALGGIASSGGWYRARCPVHQSSGLTLALKDGLHGLALKCHGGCSRNQIVAELGRLGLMDDGNQHPLDPAEIDRRREAEAAARQRRIANALYLWRNETVPATDTLAETYLWSRLLCITPPPTIRLHRSLYHRETGQRRPAMIGLVEHVHHGPVAIHATYLRTDGSGKAALDPVRKFFGPVAGAAVHLGPIIEDEWLIVAEGVENTITLMVSTGLSGWAALSADGLVNLVLPPEARRIVVGGDHDRNGVGQRKAERAAARFRAQGRRVKICLPPVPGDWNDALLCRPPGDRRPPCPMISAAWPTFARRSTRRPNTRRSGSTMTNGRNQTFPVVLGLLPAMRSAAPSRWWLGHRQE